MRAKRFNRWLVIGWLVAGLLGVAVTTLPGVALAQSGDASLQRLLDQAEFWRDNNRPDLAEDTLRRVLTADPDNPAALYQMALLELERDPDAAQGYAERLRRAAPGSDEMRRLEERLRRSSLDGERLREARQLAEAGNAEAAVRRYHDLFGDAPPADLALEYYQTLAGVEDRRAEARAGLQRLADANPGDRRVALALAKVNTYDGATRLRGIEQLHALWRAQAERPVRDAWRQALLWLPDQPDSLAPLRQYLALFADDREVAAKLTRADNQGRAARGRGYSELRAGRVDPAERAFRAALRENPKDADALAGLGLVELRRERFAQAEDYLQRAIRLNPAKAGEWRPSLESARFYGRLAAVRADFQNGRLDKAFQDVRPLTEVAGNPGRDAKLLQGEILLAQDRPVVAESLYRGLLLERPAQTEARAGLVRALLAQGRYQDADQEFAKLPAQAREQLGYLRQQRVDELRQRGDDLIAAGRPGAGEAALREAMAVAPEDPWTRLSLARFYDDQGQPHRARALIEPLLEPGAEGTPDADDLRVAALLAEKQQRWDDALALLDRLPADGDDGARAELRQRLTGAARVASLRRVLNEGDEWQVENALDDLYRNPPTDSAELGQVAGLLVDHGEDALAVALVRRDLDRNLGDSGAAVPFLNHASVLSRTGNEREARRLMALLDRRAGDQPRVRAALGDTRDRLLLDQVTALREDGQLARAYDLLVAELERRPHEPALLNELGSLYLQGERHGDAARVFEWRLQRDGADLVARRGAVAAALGAGDADRAEALLTEVAPLQDAELLLLAARTAEARGDKRQALRFADQAAGQERHGGPALAGVLNPFRAGGAPREDDRWAAFSGSDGGGKRANQGQAGVWLPGDTRVAGRWQPDGDARGYLNQAYDAAPTTPTPASPYRADGGEAWAGDWRRPARGDTIGGGHAAASDVARQGVRRAPGEPPRVAPSAERLVRIDDLRGDLRRALSPRGQGGLSLRFRDGEEGLSQLTEMRGDIGLSSVPFGGGRFTATAAPVHLNAGTLKGDAARRFGVTGATSAAAESLVERFSGVAELIDGIDEVAGNLSAARGDLVSARQQRDLARQDVTQAEQALANASTPEELLQAQQALRGAEGVLAQAQGQLNNSELRFTDAREIFLENTQRNVLYEAGIDLDALNTEQRRFVDSYLQREFGSSDFSLNAGTTEEYYARSAAVRQLVSDVAARAGAYRRAAAHGNQTDSGLAVAFGYQDGAFSADIGSTPYGFEITNLVGGVSWAPRIASNGTLRLTAQRRAVTDSLLSYAGVEDPITGDRWGGVTRSGAEIGLAWDNGQVGTYGDLGFYDYQGDEVDSNQATIFNLGAYVKPINERRRTLQTGVHLNYRGFDENRGQFTFGHGGYFSPQDYVSLAFPITYRETHHRLTWNARLQPGFQSYSVEQAPYFPTLDGEQQWLDVLADAGVVPASYYDAESESGFGLNLGAGFDYQLSPAFSLGTQIGYDTFGDYSETSAMINLLYTMEP